MSLVLVDLGSAPPSNAYLTAEDLRKPEARYPLRVLVCESCWLVQTEDFARPEELFHPSYAYFSGYSRTWLTHVERYVEAVVGRFDLGSQSRVVEVAANDGHLLAHFQDRGIPSIGIEPTASTARVARSRGLRVVEDFFGSRLARELVDDFAADLMVANNVLAHVPDINDFSSGFAALLKPDGVATFEFAYLPTLIRDGQFDTIYHEHFSYLSFTAAAHILAGNGLTCFDVEEIPTHGGSVRVFAERTDSATRGQGDSVGALLAREEALGIRTPAYYGGFQETADRVRDDLLAFLRSASAEQRPVVAYGAAAKGNTLLNYAAVGPRDVAFVADANPAKQGLFLPGSHIPIVSEQELREAEPPYILILPWNIGPEIVGQLAYVRQWGGRFVTAVPRLQVA